MTDKTIELTVEVPGASKNGGARPQDAEDGDVLLRASPAGGDERERRRKMGCEHEKRAGKALATRRALIHAVA